MSAVKSNRKHEAILLAARLLFWKHGFKRVTVEEICLEAGVSKMTFYRHFANKIELAKAIYEKIAREGIVAFRRIMTNDQTNAHQKMEEMLTLKSAGTNDISREFLRDFYASPELGLSTFVEDISRQVWHEIIEDFKKAQEEGWIRKDFKPEMFLAITTRLADMINDENLLRIYDTPQDLVMEMSRLFTYGIAPK